MTTTAQPTASPAAAKPRTRTTGRPTVSARPAAVGAVNGAVITGATAVQAVAAGIVAPPAALAAAALLAGGTVAGRRLVRRTKQPRATSAGARSGGLRWPSGGAGGGLRLPRLGKPGGSAGGGSATRSRSGGLPAAGGGRKPAAGTGSRGSAPGNIRATSGGGVQPTGRRSTRRGAAGPRLGDAIRAGLRPTQAGGHPTARQAWGGARQALTGPHPKRRDPFRQATAGVVAAGLAAAVAAWRNRQRHAIQKARAVKATRTPARTGSKIATTVPPPAGGGRTTRPRVPAPTPARTTPGGNTVPPRTRTSPAAAAAAGNGVVVGAAALRIAAEQFFDAAKLSVPDPQADGMLPVVDDAKAFPDVLGYLADAMKLRYDAAQDLPIHPAIKDVYAELHTAMLAVQSTAGDIYRLLETIHKDKLDELRNPQGNQQMWDVRANQGA